MLNIFVLWIIFQMFSILYQVEIWLWHLHMIFLIIIYFYCSS